MIINTFFCLALLFAISCDQSDDEKIEAAIKQMKADRQERTAAIASADSLNWIRNDIQQSKDNDTVSQPLGYRELKSLLPENVSGMSRANATGENEDGILLTITDLGNIKSVIKNSEYSWVSNEVDLVTKSGYEKSIIYKGHRGIEKYDRAARNGEVQILVADRFVVQAQGFKMKMEEIKSALNDVDLEKIANGARKESE